MDYVRLGTTGLKVSRLCLGTMTYGTPAWRPWVLDEAASRPFIKRALEHGINFFDTADMYSRGVSEEVVGRALKDFAKRDEVVLATKVFYPVEPITPNGRGLSRKHIMAAIDGSLRRLGMDYVDLYQIHRFDDHTPIEETLEALHDVVKAGKARYIGASSMYAWQFAKMLSTQRRARLDAVRLDAEPLQPGLSRGRARDDPALPSTEGIGVIPWSPLARGFLAGNRKRGREDAVAARAARSPTATAVLRGGRLRHRRSRRRGGRDRRACCRSRSRWRGFSASRAWPRRSSARPSSNSSISWSTACR